MNRISPNQPAANSLHASPNQPATNCPHVTVIGAGTIGLSWTGLLLANGYRVTINDPRPDVQIAVLSGIELIKLSLQSLGYKTDHFTRRLTFESRLNKAVQDADIVQECAPEDVELKQGIFEKLARFAKPSALLLSSSSGICASVISEKMKDASRMLIGHPSNPPHLLPLVEVVPCKRTDKGAVTDALHFYRSIGKHPIVIEKEVTGHVANRLQCALLREGVQLIRSGVISMENLDHIVASSVALRWAAAGPFKSLAMGAGPGVFGNFLDQLGDLDCDTKALLLRQSGDSYKRIPVEDMQRQRDEEQLAILKAIKRQQPQI